VKGKLILVPTPIDEENLLDSHTKQLLLDACDKGSCFAIEDLKPGRRRWLRYGLPREQIEKFILYNEHTRSESIDELLKCLHSGKDVYLMSDAGLPAFCDPGRLLVDRAHKEGIHVSATPFANSISLAVALSGYPHERFVFEGFIPVKDPSRSESLKYVAAEPRPVVLMETPYRLSKLLSELDQHIGSREICLAIELGMTTEEVVRGSAKALLQKYDGQKRPFVIVVAPKF
tara:strand:- start:2039 stop:2731 length:693 start_codon:yes stop_codon:yes gene_type:complete